jgi:hypothetical protein
MMNAVGLNCLDGSTMKSQDWKSNVCCRAIAVALPRRAAFASRNSHDFFRRSSGFSGATTVNEATKDHSPTPSLSPEVVSLLRASLERWLRDDGTDNAPLGDALRAAAIEARTRGVRAEELLVTLKSTWLEVGGSPKAPHSSSAPGKRLDELVTACIKAYYS